MQNQSNRRVEDLFHCRVQEETFTVGGYHIALAVDIGRRLHGKVIRRELLSAADLKIAHPYLSAALKLARLIILKSPKCLQCARHG